MSKHQHHAAPGMVSANSKVSKRKLNTQRTSRPSH